MYFIIFFYASEETGEQFLSHRCNEAEDWEPPPVLLIRTRPFKEAGDIFAPRYNAVPVQARESYRTNHP